MTALLWLAVGTVGGLAAIGRFLVDAVVSERAGAGFPFGTLAVNLSGALILGLLAGAALSGKLLLIAGTATIGSYTTFSTWMFETHRLAEDRELFRAAINIAVSLFAGFAAILAGHLIGAQL